MKHCNFRQNLSFAMVLGIGLLTLSFLVYKMGQ